MTACIAKNLEYLASQPPQSNQQFRCCNVRSVTYDIITDSSFCHLQEKIDNHRSKESGSTAVPLFAKFKLKQTNHKLYSTEDETRLESNAKQSNQSSSEHNNNGQPTKTQLSNSKPAPLTVSSATSVKASLEGPLSPRSRARLAKSKAPQPPKPTQQEEPKTKPSADKSSDTIGKGITSSGVSSYLSSKQDKMVIISSSDNKPAQKTVVTNGSKVNGDNSKTEVYNATKVAKPPRDDLKPSKLATSQLNTTSTAKPDNQKSDSTSVKPTPNKADSPPVEVKIPRPEVKLNTKRNVNQTLYSSGNKPNKTTTAASNSSDNKNTASSVAMNGNSTKKSPAAPSSVVSSSEPVKNKSVSAVVTSVKDIPSPARNSKPSAAAAASKSAVGSNNAAANDLKVSVLYSGAICNKK